MHDNKEIKDQEIVRTTENSSAPNVTLEINPALFDHTTREELQAEVLDFVNKHEDLTFTRELEPEIAEFITRVTNGKYSLSVETPDNYINKKQFPLPETVDWLPEKTQKVILGFIEELIVYHNQPIITDNLDEAYKRLTYNEKKAYRYQTPHAERQSNRVTIEKFLDIFFRNFVDRSKLRKAFFFTFDICCQSIARQTASSEDPRVQRIHELFTHFMNQFTTQYGKNTYHLKDYVYWPKKAQLKLARSINKDIEFLLRELMIVYTSTPEDFNRYIRRKKRE